MNCTRCLAAACLVFALMHSTARAHEGHADTAHIEYDSVFRQALSLLDSGDAVGLQGLLKEHPDLIDARVGSTNAPYDGYFHGANLLHHAAGNPTRGPLPEAIVDCMRVILDAGAGVDVETDFGEWSFTALGLVATSSDVAKLGKSREMMDLLIERGADVNKRDAIALYSAVAFMPEEGMKANAEYLIEKGSRVDLCVYAGLGQLEKVKAFFNEDGSLKDNACCIYRQEKERLKNPADAAVIQQGFLAACSGGQLDVVKYLHEKGGDVDAITPFRWNRFMSLHAAVGGSHDEVVAYLLDSGADPTIRELEYHSDPMGWAIYFDDKEMIGTLEKHGVQMSIFDAARKDRLDVVKNHVEKDPALLDSMDGWGTSLSQASWHGHIDVVKYLLEKGADVNKYPEGGRTPFGNAIDQNRTEIIALLKEHGGKTSAELDEAKE